MSGTASFHPASNDEIIKALGLNPKKYPEIVILNEWINETIKNTGTKEELSWFLSRLEQDGWLNIKKGYTLEERLLLYGVTIVNVDGGQMDYYDYTPRRITFSDGSIIQEELDRKKSDRYYVKGEKAWGDSFHFAYVAKKVK